MSEDDKRQHGQNLKFRSAVDAAEKAALAEGHCQDCLTVELLRKAIGEMVTCGRHGPTSVITALMSIVAEVSGGRVVAEETVEESHGPVH